MEGHVTGKFELGVLNHRPIVGIHEDRYEAATVPIVGHAATVVALAGQVLECVVRHVVVLFEEDLELEDADSEI